MPRVFARLACVQCGFSESMGPTVVPLWPALVSHLSRRRPASGGLLLAGVVRWHCWPDGILLLPW
jgi:hypothetical protein